MTLIYTNCMCSPDKQKGILFIKPTEADSGKPVPSSYSHLVSPFLISSTRFPRTSFVLHCVGKSENLPQNNLHPTLLSLFFTLIFFFPLSATSSLSALTSFTLFYPTSNCFPPSTLLRHYFPSLIFPNT